MSIGTDDIGKWARLRTAQGEPFAEGTVVAHSLVPSVLIVTAAGERIWWRHDLGDVAPESREVARQSDATGQVDPTTRATNYAREIRSSGLDKGEA